MINRRLEKAQHQRRARLLQKLQFLFPASLFFLKSYCNLYFRTFILRYEKLLHALTWMRQMEKWHVRTRCMSKHSLTMP